MMTRYGSVAAIILLLAVLAAVVPGLVFSGEEAENPCFFCHVDLIFEMQDGAHEAAGVFCGECHGESGGHVFAEDNSVKPDRLVESGEAAGFCGECHEEESRKYQKSAHGKSVDEEKDDTPNCISCHSAHGSRSSRIILKDCLECHSDGAASRNESDAPGIERGEGELEGYDYHLLQKSKDDIE